MAIKHVRARHTEHGGVAAVSERALELGTLPGWKKVAGPVPKRPKSAAFRTKAATSAKSKKE